MEDIKKELVAIHARIETGAATGRDFNRQRELMRKLAGSAPERSGSGVCLPLANWTKGKVTH